MICPYRSGMEVTRRVQKFEYNDDGSVIKESDSEGVMWMPPSCEKENCAAWIDGQCRYNMK